MERNHPALVTYWLTEDNRKVKNESAIRCWWFDSEIIFEFI